MTPSGATSAAIEVRDCTIYGTSTVAIDAAQTGAAQPQAVALRAPDTGFSVTVPKLKRHLFGVAAPALT